MSSATPPTTPRRPRRMAGPVRRLPALCLGIWAALAGAGLADERWALVLGVSRYDDPAIPHLPNTVNDARTMAGALNQMGFEVYYLENPDLAEIEATRRRIAAEQRDSELGLFYFAGHGVQLGGVNYALPSNLRTGDAAHLARSAVSVNALIGEMRGMGTETLVVILDSCRNSPFPGQAAIGTGLALVDAPDNTIIAYSTAPGEIALDGSGANSPYTAALASALDGPEQDIRDVLRLVRAQVRLATGGNQTPWFIDNSARPIMIQPRRSAGAAAALPGLGHGQVSLAATAWWTIVNSADPRDFETFIDLFPETEQASAARRQLEDFGAGGAPGFPLMDLGLPEANPEVPGGLRSIITECDVLATGVEGGLSLVEPVPHDLVNTRAALRACIGAVRNDPENPRLLGLLARVLFLEHRFPEALHFSHEAARRGSAAAYGGIAEIHRLGLDVPVDLKAAADAVRLGALAGSEQMRVTMGIYYREGWGVPQSHTEARRWFELAEMSDNASAMSALGDMYRRGQLGPANPARAVDYYLKAATLGHTDAMSAVGLAYMKADGVERDLERGLTWLSHASEQGNPYAAFHLGRAFLTGWGVDRNPAQALAYFRLSAQRSFLQAYTYIGDILAGVEGIAPDLPEALANYIIARDAGLLKDTAKSREEAADAQSRMDALLPRMTAEQRAEGERIAADWIAEFGLLDFNLVHE
ncbi:caspase family protein [Rhodovulum euryhalinum]|uniref:Putative caspase-like protein n=1 Tax=Rhodovulum euryhalinum TaxID=35805 RepID=A0A4R2KPP2_9RHOB|nr:caspase family protein [Rhodovulum euryhalinum]TCO72038.1 putative caspase-like protein [Rhodovulum euryhalinum]